MPAPGRFATIARVSETGKDGLPVVPFASAAAFEAWLEAGHDGTDGVWVKFAKKGSGVASMTYAEAVDVALCHGWIDGQVARFDERFYLQRFTPRRARSRWSKINVDKVARLEAEGRMRPAGRREVERAQADGRWDAAYDSPRTATVPDDLRELLDREEGLRAAFDALPAGERYGILYSLQEAKRPETRARRLEKVLATLRGAG